VVALWTQCRQQAIARGGKLGPTRHPPQCIARQTLQHLVACTPAIGRQPLQQTHGKWVERWRTVPGDAIAQDRANLLTVGADAVHQWLPCWATTPDSVIFGWLRQCANARSAWRIRPTASLLNSPLNF